MSRQNRVTPYGELIATNARGTLMGNRGSLHDRHGVVRRNYRGTRWIICLLEFKGRRRSLVAPGQYTELFFLDEATALAAGHRPCAECQRERFDVFRAIWVKANPGLAVTARPGAEHIDAALHRERLGADGSKLTYTTLVESLPNGALIALEAKGDAYLVWGGRLLHWTPAGYDTSIFRPEAIPVQVLTPQSAVQVLAAGYPVLVHPTASPL